MRRATIQDVARLAGVSLSTVSAVLNGKDIVAEKTRGKIEEAIARLNYHPSLYASNLARRTTKQLGLIVSRLVNPFFAETAEAFEAEARKRGYLVSLASTDFHPSRLLEAVKQMLAMRVAGLAILTSEFDEAAYDILRASSTPCVFLDVGKPSKHIGNIRVDTKMGMVHAVTHLVKLGHRDIVLIRNSQKNDQDPPLLSHRYRTEGFNAAIRRHRAVGVRARMLDATGPGTQAGFQAVQELLKTRGSTAIITVTDMVALGVYRGLQQAGLRIPEDVSVVGFDNTFFGAFMNPPLTTVDIPKQQLGIKAVEMLLRGADHGLSEVDISTSLILRSSTAPPKEGSSGFKRKVR